MFNKKTFFLFLTLVSTSTINCGNATECLNTTVKTETAKSTEYLDQIIKTEIAEGKKLQEIYSFPNPVNNPINPKQTEYFVNCYNADIETLHSIFEVHPYVVLDIKMCLNQNGYQFFRYCELNCEKLRFELLNRYVCFKNREFKDLGRQLFTEFSLPVKFYYDSPERNDDLNAFKKAGEDYYKFKRSLTKLRWQIEVSHKFDSIKFFYTPYLNSNLNEAEQDKYFQFVIACVEADLLAAPNCFGDDVSQCVKDVIFQYWRNKDEYSLHENFQKYQKYLSLESNYVLSLQLLSVLMTMQNHEYCDLPPKRFITFCILNTITYPDYVSAKKLIANNKIKNCSIYEQFLYEKFGKDFCEKLKLTSKSNKMALSLHDFINSVLMTSVAYDYEIRGFQIPKEIEYEPGKYMLKFKNLLHKTIVRQFYVQDIMPNIQKRFEEIKTNTQNKEPNKLNETKINTPIKKFNKRYELFIKSMWSFKPLAIKILDFCDTRDIFAFACAIEKEADQNRQTNVAQNG